MTLVMSETVTKTKFKAKALELFRQVEQTGEEIIITDRGRPTLRLTPFRIDDDATIGKLRGSIIRYEEPCEPVDVSAWESLK